MLAMNTLSTLATCLVVCVTLTAGCGGGGEQTADSAANAQADGLTQQQLENGVGPITTVELGDLDPALAAEGQAAFELKCSACHKTDKRYVGPALGDVLKRRTPAFVMNMILNPEGMLAEHPEAKKLLGEYMTPMANQNLTEAEARSIVEYLRTVEMPMAEEGAEPAQD